MRSVILLLLLTRIFLPSSHSQTCPTGMQGTYTIGPSGQYASITLAIDALKNNGVAGAVVLELQANYNSAAEVFPIGFPRIPCTDSIKTITIRPAPGAAGLQISGSNSLALLDFNNGKFITIDGRPGGTGTSIALTINNTNTSGSTIRFIQDASWNKIRFADIRGANPSEFNGVVFVAGSDSTTGNDFITLDSCRIFNSGTNPANLVYSYGAFNKNNTGLTINGCELFDFYSLQNPSHGIYLAFGTEKAVIRGNHFYQTVPRNYASISIFSNVYAIRVHTPFQGGHVIRDNFIGGTQRNAGGNKMQLTGGFTFKGISVTNDSGATKACLVENNRITNISMHPTGGTSNHYSMIELGYTETSFNNRFNGSCNSNIVGSMTGDSAIIFRSSIPNIPTVYLYGINGAHTSGFDSSNIRLNQVGGLWIDEASNRSCVLIGMQVSGYSPSPLWKCLVEQNTIGSPSVATSLFNGGKYYSAGIFLFGNGSVGNLVVRSNTVCNIVQAAYAAGVSVGGVNGIDVAGSIDGTLTISKNKIFGLRQGTISDPTNYCVTGIRSWHGGTVPTVYHITENEIYDLYSDNLSSSGGPFLKISGILLEESSSVTNFTVNITRNFIHGLRARTFVTNLNAVNGIFIDQASPVNVENNMIRLGLDAAGNAHPEVVAYYGIYENPRCFASKFLHNTVVLAGQSSPPAASYVFFSQAAAASPTIIRNNIFANFRGNLSDTLPRHNCMYIAPSTTGVPAVQLDNNVYFFDRPGGSMGGWPGFFIRSFAEWKSISQKDANSFFTNPGFVDSTGPASGGHIHIKSPTPIEGRGNPSFTTPLDFDGDNRASLSPVDIGADAGNFIQIEPRMAPSGLQVASVTSTSATINVVAGDGERRLIVLRRDNAVTNTPVDGQGYMANAAFGSGSDIGGNSYVVANTGTSVNVSNLAPGTTYHVRVFEFNGNNTSANYLVQGPATNFATQTVTGIIDLRDRDYSVRLFPNPGTACWLNIHAKRNSNADVTVYSSGGQFLFSETIRLITGDNLQELKKMRNYPAGSYIIRVKIGKAEGSTGYIKY